MCNECPAPKFPRKNRKNATKGSADSAVCVSAGASAEALGRTARSSPTCDLSTDGALNVSDAVFHASTQADKRVRSGKKSEAIYNHKTVRSERYRVQAIIADLFMREGKKLGLRYVDDYHKTAQCLRKPYASGVAVHKSKGHNVAFYGGLQQCGNGWTCPVCSAKIQERRRQEIAKGFDWAYKVAKKKVIMITFTFPHAISDRLKDQQAKLKTALELLRKGNSYDLMRERIGYEGLIRSLEVMYGSNGWHSHTHEAWIVDHDTDIVELREWLTKRWWDKCIKAGLIPENYAKTDSFNTHAVQIVDECKSSDYLAKHDRGYWGADRELAKASSKGTKNSDKTTIHPLELIRLYEETENEKYADLFLEYAVGVKGKAPVYWGPGLKAKVGITEKTDQEIVEEKEDKADLLALLSRDDWRLVVRKKVRAELLDVAEMEGVEGILDYLEILRI